MNSPLLPPSTSCKAKKKQTFEISILLQWLLQLCCCRSCSKLSKVKEKGKRLTVSLMWHSSTYPPTSLGQCKKKRRLTKFRTRSKPFELLRSRAVKGLAHLNHRLSRHTNENSETNSLSLSLLHLKCIEIVTCTFFF